MAFLTSGKKRTMKKKAGIITYWITQSNYGTVLQNYALQTFLRRYGFETFLIRSNIPLLNSRWKFYSHILKEEGLVHLVLHFQKSLVHRILRLFTFQNKKDAERKISDFISQNLNPTDIFKSLEELRSNCPRSDIYIAGSDQIWNTFGMEYDLLSPLIKSYLLEFAPENSKRISCAASFGTSYFDIKFENLFKTALSRFDFISCREKTGVEICRKLGFENAALQQDPTMLLSAEEYKKIADYELVPKRPYILLYLLGNDTDFSIGKLKEFAKKRNLDVIYVPANEMQKINFYKKTFPSVSKWLGLYEKANFVVTNSFHGTVFSLIFNRPFLSVKQRGKFSSQNERIDSLLEYFGLQDRFFNGSLENLFEPVDFKRANQTLTEIRKSSPFVEYVESTVNLKEKSK